MGPASATSDFLFRCNNITLTATTGLLPFLKEVVDKVKRCHKHILHFGGNEANEASRADH